jgi:erythronate-4-phosphate dehydrogenase
VTIVADENIPFAREAFGQFGTVRTLSGRSIGREDLRDADALVVRSVTPVRRELLEGSHIGFVGTATIGTDHIDLGYLRDAGIAFCDAAGSNANSVAEYVVAALLELRARGLAVITGQKLGVIGVGHVGSRVAEKGRALGMTVVEYDPPRQRRDAGFRSADLAALVACDIITLHVPLTGDGDYATAGMVDDSFLADLRPGVILLNTSRGGVLDSDSLSRAIMFGQVAAAVLDVWEGEPDVPAALLRDCALATPHIAGYSYDGKIMGTAMMAEGLARFCNAANKWDYRVLVAEPAGTLAPVGSEPLDILHAAVRGAYDIMQDDRGVRDLFALPTDARRAGFDLLRKNYRRRRKFHAWRVTASDSMAVEMLRDLGFTIVS